MSPAIADPHGTQPVRHLGAKLEDARAVMVLLHGRGATAADILGLAREIGDPEVAYLAPDAERHTWYPYSFLAPIEENEPYLSSALRKIASVIESVVAAGVSRERIAIAGFSQGACLTTEFVARHAGRYGAVIALTGGLIGPPGTKFEYAGSLEGTPAFFGSGDPDPHVPWARVQESAVVYEKLGAVVRVKRYPGMPHTVSREELEITREMLAEVG